MILHRLLDAAHIRSPLARVIIGAAVAALAISLGTVAVLSLLGLSVDPAIPAALGAIGAAAYAVSVRNHTGA
ncbi:MAG: hypothetical protein V3U29_00810 [Phycisphaeraceae bacterium]